MWRKLNKTRNKIGMAQLMNALTNEMWFSRREIA